MANPPNLVLDTLTNDVVGDGRQDLRLDVLQGETLTGTGDGALSLGRGLCGIEAEVTCE